MTREELCLRPKAAKAFGAIFSDAPTTSTSPAGAIARLNAAMAFDPTGRPGAEAIRDRQTRIAARSPYQHMSLIEHVPVWVTHLPGRRKPVTPLPTKPCNDSYYQRRSLTPLTRLIRRYQGQSGVNVIDFALAVGASYHRHIRRLYVSSRASITYGFGGDHIVDWKAYSRSYGFPATWCDAGARIEMVRGSPVIILETSRQTEVARIPVPALDMIRHVTFDGLIHGDLWAITRRPGIRQRYTWHRKQVIPSGWAMTFPVPAMLAWLHSPFPAPDKQGEYAEHGETLRQCQEEYQRKYTLLQERQIAVRQEAKVSRMARLIARLCGNLPVMYADAREAGYCAAGIRSFADHHGLDIQVATTAAALRGTRDAAVLRVIDSAARTCAVRRLAQRNRL
ncbi:MAG: hypothetical protein ACREM3_18580 [Candidatus Rokuibacteriota bacterium]